VVMVEEGREVGSAVGREMRDQEEAWRGGLPLVALCFHSGQTGSMRLQAHSFVVVFRVLLLSFLPPSRPFPQSIQEMQPSLTHAASTPHTEPQARPGGRQNKESFASNCRLHSSTEHLLFRSSFLLFYLTKRTHT